VARGLGHADLAPGAGHAHPQAAHLGAFLVKHHENVREGLVPEDYDPKSVKRMVPLATVP
jgi:hypothetical protein